MEARFGCADRLERGLDGGTIEQSFDLPAARQEFGFGIEELEPVMRAQLIETVNDIFGFPNNFSDLDAGSTG